VLFGVLLTDVVILLMGNVGLFVDKGVLTSAWLLRLPLLSLDEAVVDIVAVVKEANDLSCDGGKEGTVEDASSKLLSFRCLPWLEGGVGLMLS
jgi:hypothetical protein